MIQKPKGTKDVLPEESFKWKYVENIAEETFENYGFREIRVPTFEYTELFERGVGDTTDVVQKEMYTFEDKGGRSITLRPEGTAGTIRAYIENGLSSKPSPFKAWYRMPMFRYENVQKGRYREFNQIGCEVVGSASYLADVETINMAYNFLKNIGISDVTLNINSIGCPKCRAKYQEALREFIGKNLEQYCDVCKSRFDKNPMRILDCKEKKCKELNQGAPVILDYLCEECKEHFENVKTLLKSLGVEYKIDSGIVRGLDYYTKTVFEFVSDIDGLTVLGGGRYDGLVEELGGVETPAVGFATGEERLIQVLDNANKGLKEKLEKTPDVFVSYIGESANKYATKLVEELRKSNIYAEKDIMERSLKAQFKYADKKKAKYIITIGDDEISSNKVELKNMQTGEKKQINISDLVSEMELINE